MEQGSDSRLSFRHKLLIWYPISSPPPRLLSVVCVDPRCHMLWLNIHAMMWCVLEWINSECSNKHRVTSTIHVLALVVWLRGSCLFAYKRNFVAKYLEMKMQEVAPNRKTKLTLSEDRTLPASQIPWMIHSRQQSTTSMWKLLISKYI